MDCSIGKEIERLNGVVADVTKDRRVLEKVSSFAEDLARHGALVSTELSDCKTQVVLEIGLPGRVVAAQVDPVPQPEMNEPAPEAIESAVKEAGAVAAAQGFDGSPAPAARDGVRDDAPAAVAPAEKEQAGFQRPKKLRSGTYSPQEQMEFDRLAAQGAASGEIARRLNRAANPVSVKLAKWRKAQRAEDADAPAPEVPDEDPDEAEMPAALEVAARQEIAVTRPVSPVALPAAVPRGSGASWYSGMTGARYLIAMYLNDLRPDPVFDCQADLALVEALARGEKAGHVAALFEVPKDDLLARWRLLNTDAGSIEHQKNLLDVLRVRAAAGIPQAAE
jgi:hypothetical protein